MAGRLQVGIGAGGSSAVRILTPELRKWLLSVGRKPDEYQVIRWPIGAQQHGTARLLMAEDHVQDAFPLTGTSSVSLFLGELRLDGWTIEHAHALLPQDGQPGLYDLQLVDGLRAGWRGRGAPEHVNMLGRDGTSWSNLRTPRQALVALWQQLTGGPFALQVFVDPVLEIDRLDDLRDLSREHTSAARLLDQVAAHVGGCLCTAPYDVPDWGGRRAALLSLSSGQFYAQSLLSIADSDIVAGGMDAYSGPTSSPPVAPLARWIEDHVPSQVRVVFPTLATDGAYRERPAEPGQALEYAVDRWHEVLSTDGRPFPGDGSTRTIADQLYAQFELDGEGVPQLVNGAELSERADLISRRFYGRFTCGAGDLTLREWYAVTPSPSAQHIEWSVGDFGPRTRIRGTYDHELFGFATDRPLTAGDVSSTGGTRSWARSFGGVLIESLPAFRDVYMATITAVFGELNASYDAEADDNADISVSAQSPVRSIPPEIDAVPVAVGDPALIGVRSDNSRVLLVPGEYPVTTACPNVPLAMPAGQRPRDVSLLLPGGPL